MVLIAIISLELITLVGGAFLLIASEKAAESKAVVKWIAYIVILIALVEIVCTVYSYQRMRYYRQQMFMAQPMIMQTTNTPMNASSANQMKAGMMNTKGSNTTHTAP